jgi:nitrogen regulatory protein A
MKIGTAGSVEGVLMDNKPVCISELVREIRTLTAADFAAVALIDKNEQALVWKYGSGSRNERYKRIASPLGTSICGQVIRSGRPVVVESFAPKSGDDPSRYPIFIAENLQAIIAAPLVHEHRSIGVLLVGSREPRLFSKDDVAHVLSVAELVGGALVKSEEGMYSEERK